MSMYTYELKRLKRMPRTRSSTNTRICAVVLLIFAFMFVCILRMHLASFGSSTVAFVLSSDTAMELMARWTLWVLAIFYIAGTGIYLFTRGVSVQTMRKLIAGLSWRKIRKLDHDPEHNWDHELE